MKKSRERKRPLIGITAGEIYNKIETWAPFTYGQAHTYTDAVVRAGGIPFIMPIVADEAALRAMFSELDGLLLSGGNDVDPARYGQVQSPLTIDVSKARDAQEFKLVDWVLDADLPVLAICRGMQVLNVAHGGSLYQDIPTDVPGALDHQESSRLQDMRYLSHQLRITTGSRLAAILGVTELDANSHHHQGIDRIGEGLRVVAKAQDDFIEAFESTDDRFIFGIQSHPESLEKDTVTEWQNLFSAFVRACAAAAA